ncbi:glycoside hydrolase domain-containing protein [Paenibacillus cymbidii]|uniref:glycoside hydrolase domain-containing protein n=1 Tax=Paenibacillus cymbidii TaxID=1639034 RepID=UPI001080E1EC|nr:glycoside hydrolase domain-containing protein [Paenibacillus cymbidii]
MAKGFDCATPLTSATAAAFRRDGMEFVCRYLVPSGWKALTPAEAKLIGDAGLQLVSVFETTADRALGGRAAGLADAATALKVAAAVGQPEGSCIYFAVDFDATAAQMPSIIAYIAAASEATPAYTTGVYGSYSVVEAVIQAGACSRGWQTYAWSGGKRSARAQIYQYQNDVDSNGIKIDRNESYGSEGWWSLKQETEYPLSVKDANSVIGFLSAARSATDIPAAQTEFNRLANELRKASGQPVQ